MLLQPEKVEKAELACVHPHNYLRKSSHQKIQILYQDNLMQNN